MMRWRHSAGLVVLAVMLLGLAAGAAAAVSGGDCCAGMPRATGEAEPAPPCHSVAPTSCCEPGAAVQPPTAPAAQVLLAPTAGLAPSPVAYQVHGGAPLPTSASRVALASVVLRL